MSRKTPLIELEALSREGTVWAIVDACDAPEVPSKMYELGENRAVSLFRGEAEIQQAEIAPYLVQVDEFVLRWITKNLWTKPWGILAVARGDLSRLRTHFRKFLTVKDPEGETMYFRYYDPRILRAFLPACDDKELEKILRPLEALGIGDVMEDAVTFFSLGKTE